MLVGERSAPPASSPQAPYALVASLCWNRALWDDDAWWQARGADGTAFLETAWTEGMLPDVYAAYRRRHGVVDAYETRATQWEALRTRLLAALPHVAERALLVKGLGIEAFYPAGRRRYSLDADLVVASLDEFWDVAHGLIASGFGLEPTMLWYEDPRSRAVQGIARFQHPELTDPHNSVEVQIGMFPMTYCTRIPYGEFARDTQRVHVAGLELRTPSAHGQLLVMLGEFESRERAKLRDLFDWISVLRSEPGVDVAAVVERAAWFGVGNGLAVLRDGLRAACPPDVLAETGAFLQHPAVRAARAATSNAAHIWRHFRRVENTPLPLRTVLVQGARGITQRWNHESRFLPLLRAMDRGGFTRRVFGSGAFTYLVRLSDRPGRWGWFRAGQYALVHTPIGDFVAATNGVLTDADFALLEGALLGDPSA